MTEPNAPAPGPTSPTPEPNPEPASTGPTSAGPRHKAARIVFFVLLASAIVATFAGEKLGLITNVAVRERALPDLPEDEAVAAVRSAAAAMPRWTSTHDDGRTLEWEARTQLIGFVDDVKIEVLASSANPRSSRLRLRSASRVGASDFGTNGRRLDAFLAELDGQLAARPREAR